MTSLGGCPTSLLNKMSGDKIRRKRVEVPYNRINYEELEFVDGDSVSDLANFPARKVHEISCAETRIS